MLPRFWFVCLVSLSCVLLHSSPGMARPKAKAARTKVNEAATAQAIQKLGGTVIHANQDPKQPIVAVILSNVKLSPTTLPMLGDFSSLSTLILSNTRVDDAGLAVICGFETLEALDLQNTLVSDKGLMALKALPDLKEVHLTGSAVSEKAIVALRTQLPDTQVVWLPPLPILKTAAAYFNLGEELVLKGELGQGIRAYSVAIQADPKLAPAFHSRGWALLKHDEPFAARVDFERFIQLQPDNGLSHAGLGLALFLTGEPDKAKASAEKALKLDKNCANAYYVRGMVRFDRQEFEAALPDFEHAAELEPKDAANHERLGWTYFELKFYENALASFNAAIGLDAEFEHAYYGRGLYWMVMKKPVKAIADFTKAWQLDPSFPDYAVDLALAQATTGDFRSAAATQSQVLEIAADEDKPAQQLRLKAYLAKRLPAKTVESKPAAVESAAKPGSGKR